MNEKQQPFKLELDIAYPQIFIASKYFNSLKILNQWIKRNNSFSIFGYRKYILTDNGYERFEIFGNTIVTLSELKETIASNQTDKNGKLVVLYASNKDAQHSYIDIAKEKGYQVLLLDSPIVSHLIQKLEADNENLTFARVDADHIDKLIQKDDVQISKLSEDEQTNLKSILEAIVPKANYTVQLEPMDSNAAPFMITQPEFMRRMKEMSATGGGGMFGMGNFPDMYNLVVNSNSNLATAILQTEDKSAQELLVKQALDLAKISQGLLKGEELTAFVKRSFETLK